MPNHLRTQAGPWCGAVTDTSVVIRATVLKEVKIARVVIAESEDMTGNASAHPASTLWADPQHTYRHQVATFQVAGLRPATQYFVRLELDGENNRALPARFRTAPAAGS